MNEEINTKWYKDPDKFTRAVVIVILLISVLGTYIFGYDIIKSAVKLAVGGDVDGLIEYIRSFGNWAIVVSFVLDVIVNAASIFPSIFLSTANGLIFGIPLGILISWLAETVGVIISFLLIRYFFRNSAEALISKADRLNDIDKASEKNGFMWMMFARAMPYFPSGILTAIGAVSRMSIKDYVLANLIGKFPSTALEVVIGHDVVNYKQNMDRLAILIVVVAIVFYFARKYSMKNLDKK